MPPSIYSYIKAEESNFESDEVQLGDNWWWSFRYHVQLIFHLKNGVFFTGENNWLRAFKNIMEPMLNLAYWTEDIEVKDVVFFIESETGRALSFLIKKYHDEVYVREHDLDTLFDEITESDLDYGGVLVQKGADRPEVLALNTVAFCDQTDALGGPIGFRYFFSPGKLREMSKFGWGSEGNGATISIEDIILLATSDKPVAGTLGDNKNKVPGKTIETYIVRGALPQGYLDESNDMETFVNQLQIVAFYTDKDNKKQGVTLYRNKESEGTLKCHTSKKVYGRALGRGEAEALLHPQVWTNFLTIHKTKMLEAASKVPLYTDDPSYTSKNKIQDMENLEITTIEDGKRIYQVPTAASANIQLFEQSIAEWYEYAQLSASASDPLLGKEQPSGSTFRGQERSVAQASGLHDRRRGQRAKFIEEIYRDWIIPDIIKEITKGKEFLATLSTDELQWVAEQMATNVINRKIIDAVLDGKVLTQDQVAAMRQVFMATFAKSGNKKLITILKGEFSDVPVRMGIDIAGKQKDLVNLSDKLLSIFQFVFANPAAFQQAMQIPALSSAFNDILEFSGMSSVDFASLMQAPIAPLAGQAAPAPTPGVMPTQQVLPAGAA